MSSFQDYLASGKIAVNESVKINEADHDMLKAGFNQLTKEVESKLKVCVLDFSRASAYIGMDNKTLNLYVTLDAYGKAIIKQSSKSDHTPGTLRLMIEVADEIAKNMPYIEKTLKTVKKLFDTYA